MKDEDKVNFEEIASEKRAQERLRTNPRMALDQLGIPHSAFSFFGESIHRKLGLFIAAPQDHFEKQEPQKSFVDDPIVFEYCRGGLVVRSKWGLEASDPALVVDKLN